MRSLAEEVDKVRDNVSVFWLYSDFGRWYFGAIDDWERHMPTGRFIKFQIQDQVRDAITQGAYQRRK